ncbi:hypothetical protein CIHG_10587 [Coccidioides immitis H538.4]|uniref:Uncharacterized protein n=1 Tax=Coccidioides immitis H538.4 TaxID=396776 RepID=A0A0P6Q2Z0_COCIT|nr:hypothetical protein CIHG_10587 [Coccidioides immitis H538.4]
MDLVRSDIVTSYVRISIGCVLRKRFRRERMIQGQQFGGGGGGGGGGARTGRAVCWPVNSGRRDDERTEQQKRVEKSREPSTGRLSTGGSASAKATAIIAVWRA